MVNMSKNQRTKFAGAVLYDDEKPMKTVNVKGSVKKENYLNKFCLKVKGILQTTFSRLQTTKETDLEKYVDRNLIQVFLDWSLETIQYGVMICIFVNVLYKPLGWHNIYLVFVFGLLRWFIFDTITEIKQSLK